MSGPDTFEFELETDTAGTLDRNGPFPPSLSELFPNVSIREFDSPSKLNPKDVFPMLTSAELSDWLSPLELLPLSLFSVRRNAFIIANGLSTWLASRGVVMVVVCLTKCESER